VTRLTAKVTAYWMAAALVLVGAGCADVDADASGTPSATKAVTASTVTVIALDNTFRPDMVEVSVGATVVFVNKGRNDHDVLSVESDWGATVEVFAPGDEYQHVFDRPGTYRYYCSLHGTSEVGMTGTVVVTG
jgi:plastocyanin